MPYQIKYCIYEPFVLAQLVNKNPIDVGVVQKYISLTPDCDITFF